MRRSGPAALAAVAIVLASPATGVAHRLDEYLQATRLAIAIDHIDVELDLTPGAAIAAATFMPIDADGDGRVSAAEGKAYAEDVRRGVQLSVDGRPAVVVFEEPRFPELADVSAGFGVIRLRGTAQLPTASGGRHSVTYVNSHRPGISAYLANALVPTDRRITIAGQERDPAQQRLTVNYDVAASRWLRSVTLLAGLTIVGMLVYARRKWK